MGADADLRSAGSAGRRGAHAGSSCYLEEALSCGTHATQKQEQAEPGLCAPRPALGHRMPRRGRIRGSSKLTVSMSPRYLGLGLGAQVKQPRRSIGHRCSRAQRDSGPPGGGGLAPTSLPARPPAREEAPGSRSRCECAAAEDARCRGRAWRAGSGRGSVCAPPPPPQSLSLPGSSPQLSPRHPAAPRTLPPCSRVCGSRAKAGAAADCGAAGRPRSPPLRHPCLPSPGSWGTPRSPRKAARWRAVSGVEDRGWVPAGWAAVQRPGPESSKAARHRPGLAAAPLAVPGAPETGRLLLCPLPH